jgi:hypothetical protein|uniref:Uncharacterized protein n=1 Tax=Podoviridae sp. ctDwO1 TaxID=2827726 RepID=A0A8S5TA44_9CAUD|nr:MAG TPA: hypothetical protein [Podoviridae sp. ctDwO1]
MKQTEEDAGLSRLKKRYEFILQYVKNNPNWREEIYNNKKSF